MPNAIHRAPSSSRRRLLLGLACAFLPVSLPLGAFGMSPSPLQATAPVVWQMATEYPATAMPGEGLATFASEVRTRSAGQIDVRPSFDASAGVKSAQMPAAVKSGRLEGGDAFGGALGDVDPIFLLSSLPFVATSVESAHRLADLARDDYARAFAAQGQRLLYVTPWPPTGLWSRKPVATLDDLRRLSIRTYDGTSTDVMRAAGAQAASLSFADAMPRLRDGSVNAVLSSGDGGAGRKLWDYLPNFTAIGYAMPLSFTTINEHTYAALTPAQRQLVDAAAQATERQQWARLETRLAENYARMTANGVTIQATPSPSVGQALLEAASAAVSAWRARVGAERAAILDTFLRGTAASR